VTNIERAAAKRTVSDIRELRSNALERLAYGGLTCEQYHYTTGYIKGLDDALVVYSQKLEDLQGG